MGPGRGLGAVAELPARDAEFTVAGAMDVDAGAWALWVEAGPAAADGAAPRLPFAVACGGSGTAGIWAPLATAVGGWGF